MEGLVERDDLEAAEAFHGKLQVMSPHYDHFANWLWCGVVWCGVVISTSLVICACFEGF